MDDYIAVCLCNTLKGHLTGSVPVLRTIGVFRGENKRAVSNHSYDHLNNNMLYLLKRFFKTGGIQNHVVNKIYN